MSDQEPRPEDKKMGRPCKPIDKVEFEKLCQILCTKEEIADFFDVSLFTLYRWVKLNFEGRTFERVYRELTSQGKMSIRRMQYQSALLGSVPMQIFLGRVILKQTEVPDPEKDIRSFNVSYDRPKRKVIK